MATSGWMTTSNQYIYYTISVTQNSQSVSGNTSNVTVGVRFFRSNTGYETYGNGTVYCKINGTTYSAAVTSSQGITNSGIVLFSRTQDIEHSSDGTKTLTCSAWISHNRVTSSEQSYAQALTTIPRATTPTLSSSDVEMGQTISISLPRASSSFAHTLQHDFAAASWTTFASGATTSAALAVPLDWAIRIPATTRTYGRIRCITYNGGTLIGEKIVNFYASVPASIKPTCTVAVTDPTGYADTYGDYVFGLSKFGVVVAATTAYASPITGYSTSANGVTYADPSFTTDVLAKSGTLQIAATVTDKRGRTGSASASKTVLAYTRPSIAKLEVRRCNADGTLNDQGEYVQATITATVTPLNNANSATYTMRHKKAAETTYTAVNITAIQDVYAVTDYTYVFPADSGSSYDVELSVADNHNTTSKATSASTAFTLMSWRSDGTAMAIGKVAEESNLLDVAMAARFDGPVCFSADAPISVGNSGGTTDAIRPLAPKILVAKIGSWYNFTHAQSYSFTKVNLNTIYASSPNCGMRLVNGEIELLEDFRFIRAYAFVDLDNSTAYMSMLKNGSYAQIKGLLESNIGYYTNDMHFIYSVQRGDKIALGIGKNGAFTAKLDSAYLSVEVIG